MSFFSPTSTVFRVRRKRSADPLAGLVVSSKKSKNYETSNDISNDLQPNNNIIFRLIETSEVSYMIEVKPFLDADHKIIEVVEYNPEEKLLGKRQISVLDQQYMNVLF